MSFDNIGKRENLPEKVCRVIKESILTGELKGGDALPTEPELESQFGVSRAVIRDAVRMLKGQGLIEVRHGKGMYVTASQLEAFTDSLLTTLRRENATVWDVEQFEKIFLPQVFALAAVTSSPEEKRQIRTLGESYLNSFNVLFEMEKKGDSDKIDKASKEANRIFTDFILSIFDSTQNKMIKLMGEVIFSMRKWRTIDEDIDPSKILQMENFAINSYINAVESGSADQAIKLVSRIHDYGEKMIEIMKQAPIGTSPVIPGEIFYSSYKFET